MLPFWILTSFAEEDVYPKYFIPKGSPLTLGKVTKLPPKLYFKGAVEVKAKYQFYLSEYSSDSELRLQLYPLPESLNLLPVLVERGINEKALEIVVQNYSKVANILLESYMTQKILNGSYKIAVYGEASFVLNNFGAGYECDEAVFFGHVTSIKKVFQSPKIGQYNQREGC
jgi:hypothetical protein